MTWHDKTLNVIFFFFTARDITSQLNNILFHYFLMNNKLQEG